MKNLTNAQETQFNPNNYSESLTAFARNWQDDEGIACILNFIAPQVPVARRFEYIQSDTDQMFYSEQDDIRSSGSSFKRIQFEGNTVQAKTLNKGLSVRVDIDDIAGEDWKERYVHLLLKRLYRNELRRAIQALKTHAQKPAIHWDKNSDFDTEIRKALLNSANENGFYPNRLLFGEMAWYTRQDYYSNQRNTGARIAAELTREGLSEKLLVDETKLLRKQQLGIQSDETDGYEIFAFFAQNGLLKDEPSQIKRFVTPGVDNNNFQVYLEESTKFVDITVEHYSNIVVTSNKGISLINVKMNEQQN